MDELLQCSTWTTARSKNFRGGDQGHVTTNITITNRREKQLLRAAVKAATKRLIAIQVQELQVQELIM